MFVQENTKKIIYIKLFFMFDFIIKNKKIKYN